jgi:UDP:flavonoid glycosyltransferase YjiC (YdhE family)
MRILLAPAGTAGDVLPCLEYAIHLKKCGHKPLMLVTRDWKNAMVSGGIDCRTVPLDFTAMSLTNRDVMGSPVRSLKRFSENLEACTRAYLPLLKEEAGLAERVIGAGVQIAAYAVSVNAGIPYEHWVYSPAWFPGAHVPAFLPVKTPGFLHRPIWNLSLHAVNRLFRSILKKCGADIPPGPVYQGMMEHAVLLSDPAVIQKYQFFQPVKSAPFILPHIPDSETGEIKPFICPEKPAALISFGSMPSRDGFRFLKKLLNQLSAGGWFLFVNGAPASFSGENIFAAEKIPHSAVLPSCQAVIHHGGAGTFHRALRAGVPQVIIPHLLDQFEWGRLITKLKAGFRLAAVSKVKPDEVSAALETILKKIEIKKNAETIASEGLRLNDFRLLDRLWMHPGDEDEK